MKAKKFCIIALVLAIVLLIAPISESRAEVKISGDFEYIVLDDGTACITKYRYNDEKLIIPEKLDGISVTGIGNGAFIWSRNLKEINIPDSLEKIDDNPFILCENLLNINISADHPTLVFIDNALFYKPEKKIVSYLRASKESKYEILEGIKIIGKNAFSECTNLTEITIPNSVEKIDGNPFYRCENLLNINISADHPTLKFINNVLIYKPEKKIVSYLRASKESKYEISDGIESIGEWAFYRCNNLTEITIPNSVEKIDSNPFYECENLLNINISADHPTLAFIDNVLFYKPEKKIVIYLNTSKEIKYEIPDGIESIGDWAFNGCTNLTEIKIPESVKSIGDSAFSFCENLTEIVIPDGVKSIGDGTFSWCENLTEIKIPDGVKSIGNSTFSYCENLTEIKIPESVQSIGDSAFSDCKNLTEIKIPESVKSIGEEAFFYCSNLTELNIPESVDTIGKNAFEGCDNLTATVARDSYAKKYCQENNINYIYEDSLDWLKD